MVYCAKPLELYKISTAENRTIGAQMTQLISNSIFSLAILFAFITLALQLYETGTLGFFLLIIFFLFVSGLFIIFAYKYWILSKLLRTHTLTTLSIEILQRDIILGKRNENDLEREIIDLFPYLNLSLSKLKLFRIYLKKKGMDKFLKKLDNFI